MRQTRTNNTHHHKGQIALFAPISLNLRTKHPDGQAIEQQMKKIAMQKRIRDQLQWIETISKALQHHGVQIDELLQHKHDQHGNQQISGDFWNLMQIITQVIAELIKWVWPLVIAHVDKSHVKMQDK